MNELTAPSVIAKPLSSNTNGSCEQHNDSMKNDSSTSNHDPMSIPTSTSTTAPDPCPININDINTKTNTNSSTNKCECSEMIEFLTEQRDAALEEVKCYEDTLNDIMESIQILTRQMKTTHHDLINAANNISTTPSLDHNNNNDDDNHNINNNNEGQSQSKAHACSSIDLDTVHEHHEHYQSQALEFIKPAVPTTTPHTNHGENRNRTFSGISTSSSIATYMSEDSKRLSDIISNFSNFHPLQTQQLNTNTNNNTTISSSVGSSLMALSHACKMIEENSLLFSQESSTHLYDLHQTSLQLNQVQTYTHKVTKVAKRLYKENKELKTYITNLKQDQKVLIKELKMVKHERDVERIELQRVLRENFQEALEVHEHIMVNGNNKREKRGETLPNSTTMTTHCNSNNSVSVNENNEQERNVVTDDTTQINGTDEKNSMQTISKHDSQQDKSINISNHHDVVPSQNKVPMDNNSHDMDGNHSKPTITDIPTPPFSKPSSQYNNSTASTSTTTAKSIKPSSQRISFTTSNMMGFNKFSPPPMKMMVPKKQQESQGLRSQQQQQQNNVSRKPTLPVSTPSNKVIQSQQDSTTSTSTIENKQDQTLSENKTETSITHVGNTEKSSWTGNEITKNPLPSPQPPNLQPLNTTSSIMIDSCPETPMSPSFHNMIMNEDSVSCTSSYDVHYLDDILTPLGSTTTFGSLHDYTTDDDNHDHKNYNDKNNMNEEMSEPQNEKQQQQDQQQQHPQQANNLAGNVISKISDFMWTLPFHNGSNNNNSNNNNNNNNNKANRQIPKLSQKNSGVQLYDNLSVSASSSSPQKSRGSNKGVTTPVMPKRSMV